MTLQFGYCFLYPFLKVVLNRRLSIINSIVLRGGVQRAHEIEYRRVCLVVYQSILRLESTAASGSDIHRSAALSFAKSCAGYNA